MPFAKPKRERSPNYPAIGLPLAIALVGRIYQGARRNPMARARAMDLMGFKSVTGAAQANLSALKKYGLLVDHGGLVRVSDEAHRLLAYPDGSTERVQIERELSTRPVLFREIVRAFAGALPEDDRLRGYLVAELGFTETAAGILVRVLNETFWERTQVAPVSARESGPATELTPDKPRKLPSPNGEIALAGSADVQAGPVTHTNVSSVPAAPPSPQPIVWYVGNGINVEVRSNLPLQAKHFRLLAKYVSLAAEAAELEESTAEHD